MIGLELDMRMNRLKNQLHAAGYEWDYVVRVLLPDWWNEEFARTGEGHWHTCAIIARNIGAQLVDDDAGGSRLMLSTDAEAPRPRQVMADTNDARNLLDKLRNLLSAPELTEGDIEDAKDYIIELESTLLRIRQHLQARLVAQAQEHARETLKKRQGE